MSLPVRCEDAFAERAAAPSFCYSLLGCGVCDEFFGSSGGLM